MTTGAFSLDLAQESASTSGCGGTGGRCDAAMVGPGAVAVGKPAPLGDASNGQLRDSDDAVVRCAACSVAQLLAYKSSIVDAFLAAVGPEVLSRSVVGRQPLRDVWALRFLAGFKWDPRVAAEKFKRMLLFREENQLDSIRRRMEDGTLQPRQFPGYAEHHRAYVHSSFDVCSGRARGGRPLSVERIAKFDWPALFAIDAETQDAYMMHMMEWSFLQLDQAFLQTRQLVGYVKIFDLDGCSMNQVQWGRKWHQCNVDRRGRLGVGLAECYPEWFAKVAVCVCSRACTCYDYVLLGEVCVFPCGRRP